MKRAGLVGLVAVIMFNLLFSGIFATGRAAAEGGQGEQLLTELLSLLEDDSDEAWTESEIVTLTSDGLVGNKNASNMDITPDGRYVVFESTGDNMDPRIPSSMYGDKHIFVHDRLTGNTELIDINDQAELANYYSEKPTISDDGNIVVFESRATNLVDGYSFTNVDPEDFDNDNRIYAYDRTEKKIKLVSVYDDGYGTKLPGNYDSWDAKISGDGSTVTFISRPYFLDEEGTSSFNQIFVHNLDAGTTRIVSSLDDGNVTSPAINNNGSIIAYVSSQHVENNQYQYNIFVYNAPIDEVSRVTDDSTLTDVDPHTSLDISGDGSKIVFVSTSDSLVEGDSNGVEDIFLIDLALDEPTISLISKGEGDVESNGISYGPSISSDGRHIGFVSRATNLLPSINLSGMVNIFVVYYYDILTGKLTNLGGLEHPIQATDVKLSDDGLIFNENGVGRNYIKSALKASARPSWQTSKALTYSLDAGLQLSWTPIQDNSNIAGYRIYETSPHPLLGSGIYSQERLLGFVDSETTSFSISEVPQDLTEITYRVEVVDYNYHTSKNGPVLAFVADEEPPSWSNGAAITSSNLLPTRVTLSWPAATDNASTPTYAVYQNGQFLQEVNTNSLTVTNLQPNTAYTFYVIAKDAAGNSSVALPTLSVTTLSAAAAIVSYKSLSNGDITLTWTEGTEVAYYHVLQNEELITEVNHDSLSYTIANLIPDTTYQFKVVGYDDQDEVVYQSQQLSLTTDRMFITKASISSGNIINRLVPIDATETITVVGQPGRNALVKATYTTWKDASDEYTLDTPREVTIDIPMTESTEKPGTYVGSFTFSEGIVELRRIEAKLAYNEQIATPSLTVGGMPITVASKLKLTAQSTESLQGYKLSIINRLDGSTQSHSIKEDEEVVDVSFDRIKANHALVLRVFNPTGVLLSEQALLPVQAGRISEEAVNITPRKKIELTINGSGAAQQGLMVYFDGLDENGDAIETQVKMTDELGVATTEWDDDVEKVNVWIPLVPKKFNTFRGEFTLPAKPVIELELRPTSTVQGTVYDATGKPLEGVNVSLSHYQVFLDSGALFQTVTDAQGAYHFETYEGTAGLSFSYGRNVAGEYTFDLLANENKVVNHTFSPLTKHQLKINLYFTHSDGFRQGPVPIERYLAGVYNVQVDGRPVDSDLITFWKQTGEKVSVSVNGLSQGLKHVVKDVVLEEDGYTEVTVDLTPEVLTFSGTLDTSDSWRYYSVKWKTVISKQEEEAEWSVVKAYETFFPDLYHTVSEPGTYKLNMESEIGVIERIFQITGAAHVDLGVLTPRAAETVLKDKSSNHLTASPAKLTAGQLTKARLSYKVDRDVSDSSIMLNLPKGIELVEGSVTWNGEQAQYSIVDKAVHLLTGDLKQCDQGIITYQLRMKASSAEASLVEAFMQLGSDDHAAKERIGGVMLTKASLTIEAPANPTSLTWSLNGIGEAGSKVSVYVSDLLLGHTKVSEGGHWNMEITVPDPKGPKNFKLYAESELAGVKYRTQAKYVQYDRDQPRVTTLTIEQTNVRRTTYDLSNGFISFPSVINPNYPLLFEIGFDQPDAVENVAIHVGGQYQTGSSKAQLRDGIYYAEMVINPSVPLAGHIYVTFDRKEQLTSAPESEDDVLVNLPPNLRQYVVEEQQEFERLDDNTIQGSVELMFPDSEDMKMTVNLELERNTGYVPTADELKLAEETGIEVYGLSYELKMVDDQLAIGVEAYIPEHSIDNFAQAFADNSFSAKQFVQARQFQALDSAGSLLVRMGMDILFDKDNPIGMAGKEILSLNDSGNSLEGALKLKDKAEELGDLAERIGNCNPAMAGFFAPRINNLIDQSISIEFAKVGVSLLGIALAPSTFGGSLALSVASGLVTGALDAYVDRQTQNLRDGINKYANTDKCNGNGDGSVTGINLGDPIAGPVWIYDPSGYVYETFEDNRLEGVTATVMVKDNEAGHFVVWNAEWFGQNNPQVTDKQGKYGWDVPPGLWQVQYEKEGYVTTRSAELEVTPPHFDVNIPMISYAAPKLQVVKAESNQQETVITINSDKYVYVGNLHSDVVIITHDGVELEGELEAINPRPYSEDALLVAKGFRFISSQVVAPGEELEITVRGGSIVSYSGTELDENYSDTSIVTLKDEVAPTLTSAVTALTGDSIVLSFSEQLDKSKPLNPADFILTGTLRTVRAVDYGKDGQSVKLYLSGKLITNNEPSVTVASTYLFDLSGNAYAGGTIAVTKQMYSSNTTLRALKVAGYSLSPSFKSSVTSYKLYVPQGVNAVDVTATTSDAGAKLTINGVPAATGISQSTSVSNEEVIVTVTAEDGVSKEYYLLSIVRGTAPSNPGSGTDYIGDGDPLPTDSETAVSLEIKDGEAGTLALGDEITVTLPAGAFGQNIRIVIEPVKQAPNASNLQGKKLVSTIYEVTKSVPGNFDKPITIKLKLNAALQPGQIASIYYYDEVKQEWIAIGGKVDHSGGYITGNTDHFTKFAVFVTEPASAFNDVSGHWALQEIAHAIERGIVNGYSDETFRPNININRAEFVVMLSRALKLNGEPATHRFTDDALIPSWAKEHVALAVQAGLINGYSDGSFGPNKRITRAEMVTIINRALKQVEAVEDGISFVDREQIPIWARSAVAQTVQAGIINGKPGNVFAPQDQATRAEAVTMIIKLLEALNQ